MKLPFQVTLLLLINVFANQANSQQRKPLTPPGSKIVVSPKSGEIGQTAVVIDETLSVLRIKPSLFSESLQRMHRGRKVQILGVTEADGVRFYRVSATTSKFGWVQADAVFGKFRPTDEERLARLVHGSDGFDQIETAVEFLNLYPDSQFRPSILLLFGDLLEEVAVKLSKDAGNKLKRREMAASGAPLHSYYLNYVSLDRYRKLGIVFLFDPTAKLFHYDGESWKEIVKKYAKSTESVEAQKRLDSLKTKMVHPPAK